MSCHLTRHRGRFLATLTVPRLQIVVLFGWMDAKINHIQKYATSYRTLYPRSDLLIVQSHSSEQMRSFRVFQIAMKH